MRANSPPSTQRISQPRVVDPGMVALSYLVPAHNSTPVIAATLRDLAQRLRHTNSEIIVVENGSTDGTLALLRELESNWPFDRPELRIITSEKGLGNALRGGVVSSRGDVVVFGADDLPFGFDELDAAEEVDVAAAKVVIGSKAHPASQIQRSFARNVLSGGFRLARRLVCGMHTGDPQGTFVLDGSWARSVVGSLREPGFLLTTELVYLAELQGLQPLEVPVRLRADHDAHGTRVRPSDVRKMLVGLLSLRRRRQSLSSVA
jgi:glycosyltransferase involved in cell wall biosynthesis